MKKFIRHETDNYDLQKTQDNLSEIFKSIPALHPLFEGHLISGISIETGTVKVVNHKLGRKLQGYVVVLRSTESDVWDNQATNETPSKTLELNTDANTTVTLWVF